MFLLLLESHCNCFTVRIDDFVIFCVDNIVGNKNINSTKITRCADRGGRGVLYHYLIYFHHVTFKSVRT